MTYRAKKYGSSLDGNHRAISAALSKAGYSVGEVSAAGGFCDLVVCRPDKVTVLFEVKNSENAAVYLTQLQFASNWKGYIAFVETPERALATIKYPEAYCLTQRDKDWLAQFVIRFKQGHRGNKVGWASFKTKWAER